MRKTQKNVQIGRQRRTINPPSGTSTCIPFRKRVLALAVAVAVCLVDAHSQELTRWDCTAWRTQMPSIELSDVRIEASDESQAWDVLSRAYFIRPIRVDYAPPLTRWGERLEIAKRSFSFRSEQCSVKEVMDAVTERYERMWTQDGETGTLWTYPASFEPALLDRCVVDIESPLTAVPLRSRVLDPYFEKRKIGGVRLRLGPYGIIRGRAPVYRFGQYAVDIPQGKHTLREVLNQACTASPTQSFMLHYYFPIRTRGTGEMSSDEFVISTDSIVRSVPVSDVLAAFVSRYLSIQDGRNVSTDTLGQLLSSPDPAIRRASQHVVEITENSYHEEYEPHAELTLIQNLWYALAYDRYDKMSHEGLPSVSKYILENVTGKFLRTCPDSHLALLLALERARIERDYSWLHEIKDRVFTPEELRGLEHEVLYIAYRCEAVWNALRQPESEYFIDTGGWAASFMDAKYPKPYDGPTRRRSHPAEYRGN